MSWPEAEVAIDGALVAELLAGQHPDLIDRPLTRLDAGWDNELWRLGADLVVRLPRRTLAVSLIESEQRWLPELAPRLPLPVPAPVRIGRPAAGFPWPWSIVPWLEGEPGDRTPLTDPCDAADRLAGFLRALHREAPSSTPRNTWRGVPLRERADRFAGGLASLEDHVDGADRDRLWRAWDAAAAAPAHPGPPVWIHGDLHPANVLLAGGTISAVIDFGDLTSGDPATDLAGAWMLLPDEVRPRFWDAYGSSDPALVARSTGWALLFGVMLLEIGLRDKPTYERIGRATLARVLDAGLGGPDAGVDGGPDAGRS